MRGFSIYGDLFSIFVLIATIMIVSLLVWSFIIIQESFSLLQMDTPRRVELTMFTYPIKYDSMMLAFLEYEYDGIPIKRALNAVAIQGNPVVWLEGKWIDTTAAAEEYFMIDPPKISKAFLLRIQSLDMEIKVFEEGDFLVSSIEPLRFQKTSIDMFSLNGELVYLELFVRD